MTDLVKRAAIFATSIHAATGRRLRYTNEPFIVHPMRVAELVAGTGARPEVVAAAWLHDVLEDTPVTLGELSTIFGADVASLVDMVTMSPHCLADDLPGPVDHAQLARASDEAQTICIASLIDNTTQILRHETRRRGLYLHGKREILRGLGKGDAGLYIMAAMAMD
ncbi:metal dependent phosphohydrolase [Gluconacetobacter sacchari DSM 12717]|uniref:HD domain-containing protein n=2 Tax=Gluconacetobacter sacchari TaxID=92759 RepID=A0A7W4NP23_9PROT|nr:HD domain-containing protein [Gluconacetobacter sacchari]MBB2161354.1 HD domain-containing protein [Gluconacetobacter sacchari]GBQ29757.1 metal dependent phosphohydrolase [Gluconacetobacter sacchari DSM 12717]